MQKTFLKKQLFFTILFIISILYNIINKNKENITFLVILLLVFSLCNYIYNYKKK